jgi:putative NIF3 family GTP cyclohydrolase 1 type 2
MNTQEIMDLSLELSGFDRVPADSQIFNPADNIRRVLFGIDIEKDDLVYAKENGYDLVIAHHPPAMILGDGFVQVLGRHRELLKGAGVDPVVAERASEQNTAFWRDFTQRADSGRTHQEVASEARQIGIPLMNIHLPCDEIGRVILQKTADRLGSERQVARLIEAYSKIPEIQKSDESVELVCGLPENDLGKVVVIHGAGTNGGYTIANALFESGISTVVYIHLFQFQGEDAKRLKEESKGNLIVTGHYGSDSLGINPLIDELEDMGLEITCCNKLIRINRTQ